MKILKNKNQILTFIQNQDSAIKEIVEHDLVNWSLLYEEKFTTGRFAQHLIEKSKHYAMVGFKEYSEWLNDLSSRLEPKPYLRAIKTGIHTENGFSYFYDKKTKTWVIYPVDSEGNRIDFDASGKPMEYEHLLSIHGAGGVKEYIDKKTKQNENPIMAG